MKKLTSIIGLLAIVSAAFGADVVRYGTGNVVVNSANSSATVVTNGLYPNSVAAVTTATNLVLLNPGSFYADRDISLQFTAAATAASTTNAVFVLTATTANIAITNNAANGWAQSASPRSTYLTVTLPLNGTTAVCTNIVLSPASTPAFANGVNLYLETVAMGAGTASLTNYSITVAQ